MTKKGKAMKKREKENEIQEKRLKNDGIYNKKGDSECRSFHPLTLLYEDSCVCASVRIR